MNWFQRWLRRDEIAKAKREAQDAIKVLGASERRRRPAVDRRTIPDRRRAAGLRG